MNKKYLALLPLLAINFSQKKLEANYGNLYPKNQNIFANTLNLQDSQNSKNINLQIKLNNFINFIA